MHIIAYSSHSLIPAQKLEDELSAIRNTAQTNNLSQGITGALFYKEGNFLQIIEGNEDQLRALMKSIEQDNRHENLTYLVDHKVENRGLNAWSMEVINLDTHSKLSLNNLQKVTKSFLTTFFETKNETPNSALILDFYNSLLK